MIEFRKDDLFTSGCEALVNPCNTVGVMGAGLAKAFKLKYPDMYKDYKAYCKRGGLRPGGLHVYVALDEMPKYIINFPTKDDWIEDSKLEYIDSGLKTLQKMIKDLDIKSIGVPAIGCGLGGLEWSKVKALIEGFAEGLPDVRILVYEPK